MPKLSNGQRKFWAEAMNRYHKNLPGSPAAEYLESRKLTVEDLTPFRLGYVAEPLPGHDMYAGMLAIPYLRWNGDRKSPGTVVSMRFRCIIPDCDHPNHGKYMSVAGDNPRLFNTIAFLDNEDRIAICEGEIDAVTATLCGLPAVGVAGAEAWKPHFSEPFLGYEVVYILADGDDAGMRFATKVAKELPNAKILPCSPGQDVNSEYQVKGKSFLMERIERR